MIGWVEAVISILIILGTVYVSAAAVKKGIAPQLIFAGGILSTAVVLGLLNEIRSQDVMNLLRITIGFVFGSAAGNNMGKKK